MKQQGAWVGLAVGVFGLAMSVVALARGATDSTPYTPEAAAAAGFDYSGIGRLARTRPADQREAGAAPGAAPRAARH